MKCDFNNGCKTACRAEAVIFSVSKRKHYGNKILCRCGAHYGWDVMRMDFIDFRSYDEAIAYQAMRCL